MSEYASKKGAVKLEPRVCAPMSFHEKSLPGGDSAPTPQSFSRHKGEGSGDLRPFSYRADQVLAGVGGK